MSKKKKKFMQEFGFVQHCKNPYENIFGGYCFKVQRGGERMIVGFTITYAISAYHH
jgi:hypothetical protein